MVSRNFVVRCFCLWFIVKNGQRHGSGQAHQIFSELIFRRAQGKQQLTRKKMAWNVNNQEPWTDYAYRRRPKIAISCRPKSYFFVFSQLLLFPCRKTLVLRFFSINSKVILKNSRPTAENFSILLENLLKKIEIQVFFDTEATTARRNKKIRLWQKGT